jgi:hydroxymethylpyrimidine pyrophosphatase-like HAD family hydrolase
MTGYFMLHIAAIDLDETLLGHDGQISVRSLAALRAWQASGKEIVIATGRPYRSVGRSLPEELQQAPLICYNGAELHLNGAKIYENFIPTAAARQIVEQLLAVPVEAHIGVELGGTLYLNRPMNRPSPYEVADLLAVTTQPAAKVLVFSEHLAAFAPVLHVLPAGARAMFTPKYPFAQILAGTADKAEALRVLVEEHWGRSLQAVVAFGDDTNDVEMVRVSGLGVAMANAVEAVKAVATHTTAANDEDGVALVLERLLAGTPINS